MLTNLTHTHTSKKDLLALYKGDVEKVGGVHFATQKELIEFTNDGLEYYRFLSKITDKIISINMVGNY